MIIEKRIDIIKNAVKIKTREEYAEKFIIHKERLAFHSNVELENPKYLSSTVIDTARLLLLHPGWTNNEYAEKRYLGIRTIQSHNTQIFNHWGVSDKQKLEEDFSNYIILQNPLFK